MGILDEAIREHLDLKRQHGAAESELRKLEDEAFGPPARPDEPAAAPAAEALATEPEAEPAAPAGFPETEVAPAAEEIEPEAAVPPPAEPAPPPAPEPPAPAEEPPSDEETAIADQPTELYDVDEQFGPAESPSAEELVSEEIGEPRLAPGEGVEPGLEPEEPAAEEGGEDFFSEQSLSDELDRALDAPETEEAPAAPEPPPAAPEGAPEPAEGEEGFYDEAPEDEGEGEDVLEETPEFLQDTPESDRLWFEQKPPKDFDFDD
jgi:hypothetical protein